MTNKLQLAFALIATVTLFVVFPVTAAINTISQGNTVFIGEQGLDVSGVCTPACSAGTQLGWWASGASIATSSPDAQTSISDPHNFFISPTVFGPYTGSWYVLPGKTAAFTVTDPQLDLRAQDTSASVDINNGWVYRGDVVGFQIDSNLNAISQRGTSALVTIYVQPPAGGTYTALVNGAATNSIVDIPVTSNPTNTGGIWDTGNAIYPSGTYTVWAECNVNHMYDNYGVPGKTITTQVSLLDQEQNPLIRANIPTTNTPVQSTTVPATTTNQVPVTTTATVTAVSTSTPPATTPTVIPETTLMARATGTTTGPTTTTSPGFDPAVATLALVAGSAILLTRRQ